MSTTTAQPYNVASASLPVQSGMQTLTLKQQQEFALWQQQQQQFVQFQQWQQAQAHQTQAVQTQPGYQHQPYNPQYAGSPSMAPNAGMVSAPPNTQQQHVQQQQYGAHHHQQQQSMPINQTQTITAPSVTAVPEQGVAVQSTPEHKPSSSASGSNSSSGCSACNVFGAMNTITSKVEKVNTDVDQFNADGSKMIDSIKNLGERLQSIIGLFRSCT